jgi:hypothetical protein
MLLLFVASSDYDAWCLFSLSTCYQAFGGALDKQWHMVYTEIKLAGMQAI